MSALGEIVKQLKELQAGSSKLLFSTNAEAVDKKKQAAGKEICD